MNFLILWRGTSKAYPQSCVPAGSREEGVPKVCGGWEPGSINRRKDVRRKEPLMVDTKTSLSGKYSILHPNSDVAAALLADLAWLFSWLSPFPSTGELRLLFEVKCLVKELSVLMFPTCPHKDFFWISCHEWIRLLQKQFTQISHEMQQLILYTLFTFGLHFPIIYHMF